MRKQDCVGAYKMRVGQKAASINDIAAFFNVSKEKAEEMVDKGKNDAIAKNNERIEKIKKAAMKNEKR